MSKTNKRQRNRRPCKTQKSRNGGRKQKQTNKRLAKQQGGSCGCNQSMTGGSNGPFAPSFSGLHESKFYPLNELNAGDPSHSSISSRLLPNTPVGMSSMRGGGKGKRGKKQRQSKRDKKQSKKMKGGMNMGSVLSQANSMILGNGIPDNIVANQGGLSGVVTSHQILSGNHNPMTSVYQPLNTLYSYSNPPMV